LNTSNYTGIRDFIFKGQNIVLSTHINPDGDTLGSALGLHHYLKQRGIQTTLLTPELASDNLRWLDSYDAFIKYKNDPEAFKNAVDQADIIIHIDYNAFHRTGNDVSSIFEKVEHSKQHLMIDHHPNPAEGFAAYISDPSACATAQLVYQLIDYMGGGEDLNTQSASCLYTGLITDTGSFSYGMEDEKPYLIAAALVRTGIDDRLIHEKIYSTNSLNRLKLSGFAISEKLEILENGKWALISLTKEELAKYDYQAGDTEGLANTALSINGVLAAVLLTEKDGKIRLSFRSKGDFAVNRIAREHFGGGGHLNAAGGDSFLSMNETIAKLKACMNVSK